MDLCTGIYWYVCTKLSIAKVRKGEARVGRIDPVVAYCPRIWMLIGRLERNSRLGIRVYAYGWVNPIFPSALNVFLCYNNLIRLVFPKDSLPPLVIGPRISKGSTFSFLLFDDIIWKFFLSPNQDRWGKRSRFFFFKKGMLSSNRITDGEKIECDWTKYKRNGGWDFTIEMVGWFNFFDRQPGVSLLLPASLLPPLDDNHADKSTEGQNKMVYWQPCF